MISIYSCSRPVLLASVFLFLAIPKTEAEEPLEPEPPELEHVLVTTPSRTEENINEVLASVSVISASDIQASAAQDLLELLRLQSGIDIVRTGGAGAQTSLFMRGSSSNHTLVLIDGVRVASTHTGSFPWENMPLNQIERIEIVRGPRASFWGSDAIGGVIQIFTRQLDGPHVRATSGSYSTNEFEAGTGFSLGSTQISMSAAYRDSGGFSSQNEDGFSYHPDDDGYESRNLGISAYTQTRDGSWQLRILVLDSEVEFDEGISTSEQLFTSLSRNGKFRDDWSYRLRAGYTDDQLDSDFIFFSTGFESRRLELGFENSLQLDHGGLSFGFDLLDESGASADSYDQDRHNHGVFALWDQPLGDASVQLSGRLDDNSLFGSEFTYQAAVGVSAGESGEILGLWGTAFRAPTFSEQYSPGFGGLFAGNAMLEPESSSSLELVYRLNLGTRSRVSLSAYQTDVDQLIAFSGVDFQAVNINEAELRGVEIEFSYDGTRWTLTGNTSLQHTEDLSTGSSLLRRPDQKASVKVHREFGDGSWLGGEWFASGDRLDVGGQVLPGYALMNLVAGYRLSQALSLELRVDNLFDREYEPATGFNSADRSAFLSLDWSP